jgi:hypothetical protein
MLPRGLNPLFFPVLRENTGKKPGFGLDARKNIPSDQALAGPVP